ncbi:hypothetical protein [Flavobacterium sp.]|uniref:hypothetical protein n=1 Tax=Flavobacterium sp. TaxID=239 RepID=UPI00334038BA
MKVDEFITIYKLLTEQSFYTLPFCILSIAGFLYYLSGFLSKGLMNITKKSILIYIILLMLSLIVIILRRDYEESLRKDALKIKQYFILYGGDYEAVDINNIKNTFDDISYERIDDIVNKFPNDFTYTQTQKNKETQKLLVLNDTTITNSLKKRLENLVYLKLKSTIDTNHFISFDSLRKTDARITNRLIETVTSQHPDEFIVQRDIYKPNELSWVIIKRIK